MKSFDKNDPRVHMAVWADPIPTEEISDDEVTEVRERTPIKEDCKVLLNFAAQAVSTETETERRRQLRLMLAYLESLNLS